MLGHQPSTKHYIRVVATYILTTVAVVGGTYFVIQLARGYQLNLTQQQLELTGLIRFESNPDAAVLIDGQNSGEQTPARLSLVEGSRLIALEQTGYQQWSRIIDVEGGSVDSITYPFLIPFDVEAGTKRALSLAGSDMYSFDSTASFVAVADGSQLSVYRLLEGQFAEPYRQLSLERGERVQDITWAESSEQLLLRVNDDDRRRWLVADISTAEPELIDITSVAGDLTPRGFVVDVEQRVLLSGADQLWLMSVENQSLQLLSRSVDSFAFNNAAVVWHDSTQSESLQIWSQDEAETIPVLEDIIGELQLEISSYSNQTNVAYTQSGDTRVIVNALRGPFERELEEFSSVTAISPGGLFVLGQARSGDYIVHDIEANLSYEFDLVDELDELAWSGTHHFVARGEAGVYVVDYDGSNQRRVNFVEAEAAVLSAQKIGVFSVDDELLMLTPLR